MNLSKCRVHPASTSSAPDRMLWGSPNTSWAVLAAGGSLFIFISRVWRDFIGTLDGVSNFTGGNYIFAFLHLAFSPMHEVEAAVSKNADVSLGFGSGAQPRVLSCVGYKVLLIIGSSAALRSQRSLLTPLRFSLSSLFFLFSGSVGQWWGR